MATFNPGAGTSGPGGKHMARLTVLLLAVAAGSQVTGPATEAQAASEEPVRKVLYLEQDEPPVPQNLEGSPDFAALARHAQAAVVSIVATPEVPQFEDESNPSAREFFERFYGGSEPPTKGMASGFVIRSDGYILTNGHVVEDSSALAVTLGDEEDRSYPAVVVGRDDLSDLALIKIDAGRPLHALPLGDSDQVAVGDWVTAIGNPFGLSHTVTVGIVSFKGRNDVNPSGRPGYYDFIQTDASINPGNSGGPLLDRHGRVIGISAAVNANGQGIGFAIPVNMAKDILPALYEDGFVARSFLGVSIQDLSSDLADSFGVRRGVVVTELSAKGPAQKAGLQIGDVIVSFENETIERAHRLRWLASSAGVGSEVRIGYVRGGQQHVARIRLAELPGHKNQQFRRTPPPETRRELAPLGFAVDGRVNGPNGRGLRVSEVDSTSAAYVAGLREGDVILSADDQSIERERDLQTIATRSKGKVVRLYIQRGVKPMYVAFRAG